MTVPRAFLFHTPIIKIDNSHGNLFTIKVYITFYNLKLFCGLKG